jgi:hypothetical protein
MKEEKKPPPRIGKTFEFFVSCSQIVSMVTGVIALVVSVIGLIWAIKNPNTVVQVFQVLSGEATSTPVVIILPTDTPLPTYTPQPTYTPFPTLLPTETPIPTPTATLFVPPADGVLFQDNFDSGDLTGWTQINGKWIVSDGRLTKLTDDNTGNDYQWISLDRPEWKNYILSLDINKPTNNVIVVAVRDNTSTQPIGFEVGWGDTINLVLISSNWTDNTEISGRTGESIQGYSDVNIQVEVQGDTYILKLNRREIQRVTLSGYESGGISIGAFCPTSNYGCTKFDNVKVTYLP